MHHEGNITHAIFHSIVKESISPFQTNDTLHHEEKIASDSSTYTTRTSAFPKTTLCHERNIIHVNFPFTTSTNALTWNALHHERKIAPARFIKNNIAPWRKSNRS